MPVPAGAAAASFGQWRGAAGCDVGWPLAMPVRGPGRAGPGRPRPGPQPPSPKRAPGRPANSAARAASASAAAGSQHLRSLALVALRGPGVPLTWGL
jgi:hypothetical protein